MSVFAATLLGFFVLLALWLSRKRAWWVASVSDSHPRILMYHMICQPLRSHKYRGLRVAPAMFERQLAWMSAEGWNFVTMSELREQYESLPPKTVAITFDDGFLDNYTEAFPLLKRYQAKATLYLLIDRHDNEWQTRRKAHHNSGEILREQKLSDAQVREMLDSGIFELGGHTIRHINLAAEDLATKTQEVVEGRRQLQEQFGAAVNSFAYPFGIYGDEDVELVGQAGFTSAVTVEEGIDTDPDFMRLKRIKVSGKDRFVNFKTRMRIGKRGY